MAGEDDSSSKSSEFGDDYRPKALNYSDLGEDCHYLSLREADPVKFKKTSGPKNIEKSSRTKGTLNSLKDLVKEKKMLMRALNEKPPTPEKGKFELIDLTFSDEENTTVQLVQSKVKEKKVELAKEQPANIQSLKVQTLPNTPLKKKSSQKIVASDFFEDSDVIEEPCAHCKQCRRKKRKKVRKEESEIDSSDSYEDSKRRRRRREKIKEEERRNINRMRLKRNYESPSKFVYREPSLKAFHDVEEAFGDFRCRVCNIEVHSEVTLQTHLVGRKHLKTLKSQAIPEVAIQSLEQFSSKPSSCISFDHDGNQQLYYPPVTPGMTRIRVKKIAKLQSVAESYRKQPVTGLTYITEICLPNEVVYYCELCDANCAPNTIMCHLIGFKHKLNFFRLKYPIMYERFQYKHKRDIENEMMKLLFDYDKTHGRGLIKVEEDVDELHIKRRRRSYSPHRGNCGCKPYSEVQIVGCNAKGRNVPDSLITDDLDLSMADFFCKVCDSHMNNEQMWEAHIRGRRHLKNKKKGPGENPAKIKNIYCPGEKPKLMNDLLDIREPVVGLNYIQEVQGRAGNQYKCFLCGACCTSFDIIEHIVTEKHRMKLLEAENKKGRKNAIELILNLSLSLSPSSREKLVAQEAAKFQREYGKGRVLVYKSKDIFPNF